ncbi:hypothetical protein JZU46_04670 [bacterium]|nr:hypothetical protein [bacterium]
MEFRTVIIDSIGTSDKVIAKCMDCDATTVTYQYKGKDTLNKSELKCKGCGNVLENLEELSKKKSKRILFHTKKG